MHIISKFLLGMMGLLRPKLIIGDAITTIFLPLICLN